MEIVEEGQERYLVEYTDENGYDERRLFDDLKSAFEFCATLESFSFYKIKRCFVGEE